MDVGLRRMKTRWESFALQSPSSSRKTHIVILGPRKRDDEEVMMRCVWLRRLRRAPFKTPPRLSVLGPDR